jgi:2-aminoethylphosphonate transport system permease protein
MTATLERPPAGTAAPRPEPFRWRGIAWTLPPLLLVLGFAVYPMARVLTESLDSETGSGLDNWSGVLGSALFRTALWRTVQIAALSTLGCLVLGTFVALVLAFVPFPGSKVVGRLIDAVLSLPSFLITLAFTFLYGTAGAVNALIAGITGDRTGPLNFLSTPLGVIAAEITFFTPFVVRPLLAAFTQIPREQLGASPLRVLRSVVMPEAWPALLAGGSLVLLLTLNEFGIVLFTGAKDVVTLPVLIYTRGIVTFDLPGAAVIATVQVALSLSLYCTYRFVFAELTGGSRAAVDETI